MTLPQSKVTAQGQISVPAEVRKKLGIGPGSVLEWEEISGQVIVRKAGRYTSEEIHAALFGTARKQPARAAVKEGIKQYMRKRHARN